MKIKFLSRVIASVVTVLMCFSSISIASAAEQEILIDTDLTNVFVSPNFLAIARFESNLILGSDGKLTCEGKTEVQYGYIAGLTIELQQYNGQWYTIKTWNASDSTVVSLSKDWYAASGYQYRLKLTHTAMNSNSTVIESSTSYSKTVAYN